jgi:hypothetical protein
MIDIRRTADDGFAVTIRDAKAETHHDVTFSRADHAKLGDETHTQEACVEAAFRFLLDREPKESILRRFDLMVIGRYFPEFERELPRYLADR